DSTAVPITAFDTLATLDRKVHVAGNDLLVRVLSRSASGILGSTPQSGDAREFRKPAPHRLRQYTKQIVAERPPRLPGLVSDRDPALRRDHGWRLRRHPARYAAQASCVSENALSDRVTRRGGDIA